MIYLAELRVLVAVVLELVELFGTLSDCHTRPYLCIEVYSGLDVVGHRLEAALFVETLNSGAREILLAKRLIYCYMELRLSIPLCVRAVFFVFTFCLYLFYTNIVFVLLA